MVKRNRKLHGSQGLAKLEKESMAMDKELYGDDSTKLADRNSDDALEAMVKSISHQVNKNFSGPPGTGPVEIMSRMKQDSLLNELIEMNGTASRTTDSSGKSEDPKAGKNGVNLNTSKTIYETLQKESTLSTLNELFYAEKDRMSDYNSFFQIYEYITLVGEVISTYADNIISPDDFTKTDIEVVYDDPSASVYDMDDFRSKIAFLTKKYNLTQKVERIITRSLIKGDFFVAILNLKQELQTTLSEGVTDTQAGKYFFNEHHVPAEIADSTNFQLLTEFGISESSEVENSGTAIIDETEKFSEGKFRSDFAEYLNEAVVFNENADQMIYNANRIRNVHSADMAKRNGGSRRKEEKVDTDLTDINIQGSIIKMIEPSSVVKLYDNGITFGYFFVEYVDDQNFGKIVSTKTGGSLNTPVASAIDTAVLSAADNIVANAKRNLISKMFVKTLAKRLNKDFISENPAIAGEVYEILRRAKLEHKRGVVTFIAPDQMVHFTPDGSEFYGESILSKIKFIARLYIGCMTNAFMRNAIRRPEKLVYYIDVGLDNDASNVVQKFMRTIKQKEVKFSSLNDITTVINNIGEFHDLYIPTANGERPVEVETINTGASADVNTDFLDYLRKSIIAGTGVPAAFVGYSEEVSFARTLSMDNGRFLRRVIRHQKCYGPSFTRMYQLLYRNEYTPLAAIIGTKLGDKTSTPATAIILKKKTDRKAKGKRSANEISIEHIIANFPSPAAMNITNMTDQLDAIKNIAETLSDILVTDVTDESRDHVVAETKKSLVMSLAPSFKWELYNKMVEEAKIKVTKDYGLEGMDTANGDTDTSGTEADTSSTDADGGDADGGDAPI